MVKLFTQKNHLRLYVFVFYFITGLFPLIIISYYYLNEYANNLQNELENNVQIILNSLSTSTTEKIEGLRKNTFAISQLSIVKAGMTEYLTHLKKKSLSKRLQEFSDYFGFDYYKIVRKNGQILFKNFDKLSIGYFEIKKEIRNYDNKLLGNLYTYINYKKLFNTFIKSPISEYTANKRIFYKDELIYDNNVKVIDPISFYNEIKSERLKFVYSVSKKDLKKQVISKVETTAVIIFMLVLGAITVSLFFLEWIIRPFGTLIKSFKVVSGGNFDYRINEHHSDDIDFVYEQFNKMVTRLSETQDKLLQTEKLTSLGIMSASIAHEIKNPLSSIKMGIDNLKKINDQKALDVLNILSEEIERINKTINEFLNFSKPSKPNKVEINLKDEINDCIKLLLYQIRKSKVVLKTDINNCICFADKNQLHQIIINLLLNAIQASSEGCVINIKTYNENNLCHLVIEDTGEGISKDVIDKIFDPFFTTKHTGTGLGLSVVYSLCKKNGIKLEINSIKNEGTTVKLIFEDKA